MNTVNSLRQDLKDVFEWLKGQLALFEGLGLEPPRLSTKTIEYLKASHPPVVMPRKNMGQISSLEELRDFIGQCTRCHLHKGRLNLVFGEGNAHAGLVFVGEAPGREEDLVGRPFVGEAGRLLTRIIENGMGVKREDVYICNVIKCRPPGNRDPEPVEVQTCLPFLMKQLELINPRVICILGRIAGQALIGKDFKITKDRGTWFELKGIPVMPTFHPAYLLRNPKAKRAVWEDIKKVMKRLGIEVQANG